MEIQVSDKKIDLNAKDKQFIKEALSSARKGTTQKGTRQSIRRSIDTFDAARKSRPLVKAIVEDLCKEGVTITVSYKGDRVLTVGSEADSKLTRLLTGTKGIEINSPRRLVELTSNLFLFFVLLSFNQRQFTAGFNHFFFEAAKAQIHF